MTIVSVPIATDTRSYRCNCGSTAAPAMGVPHVGPGNGTFATSTMPGPEIARVLWLPRASRAVATTPLASTRRTNRYEAIGANVLRLPTERDLARTARILDLQQPVATSPPPAAVGRPGRIVGPTRSTKVVTATGSPTLPARSRADGAG